MHKLWKALTDSRWVIENEEGALPLRHGRCDVSIVQSGMPRKQDDTSIAKDAVEKELRTTQEMRAHNAALNMNVFASIQPVTPPKYGCSTRMTVQFFTCPVSYLPCCFRASNTPTVSKIFPSGLFLPNRGNVNKNWLGLTANTFVAFTRTIMWWDPRPYWQHACALHKSYGLSFWNVSIYYRTTQSQVQYFRKYSLSDHMVKTTLSKWQKIRGVQTRHLDVSSAIKMGC